jgi:hypothetical protein
MALVECRKLGITDIYIVARKVLEASGCVSSRVTPTTRSQPQALTIPAAADVLHMPERR